MRPFYIYNNWSAYDELSDNIPLTEDLAMFQLDQMKRLMAHGVTFDAYMMDAFWYEQNTYLQWKGDRWPNGPHRWLREVKAAGLEAGLWFPTNTTFQLTCPDAWRDSLSTNDWGFCCFEGGFMEGFLNVLRHWYREGITIFKLDFADFDAAPLAVRGKLLPSEIRRKNTEAYRDALRTFRREAPDAKILAYNGFEEAQYMENTSQPFRKVLDTAWLEVFDAMYCGDPRPADLPQPNFWRTLDIYADHMVRYLNLGGIPFERIENCALMLGKAGTCYQRGCESWEATAVLSLARKGKIHLTYGNLEDLSDLDASRFAHYQKMYESVSGIEWVGGTPGKGEVYGYRSGNLLTLVNPSLQARTWPETGAPVFSNGSLGQNAESVTLGPGSVVVLRTDQPAKEFEPEVPFLQPLEVEFAPSDGMSLTATIAAPGRDLHLGFQQSDDKALALRTSGGPPPNGTSLGNFLKIKVWQGEKCLEVERTDDRMLWSGLSWAYGIVSSDQFDKDEPVHILFESTDPKASKLDPFLYLA